MCPPVEDLDSNAESTLVPGGSVPDKRVLKAFTRVHERVCCFDTTLDAPQQPTW